MFKAFSVVLVLSVLWMPLASAQEQKLVKVVRVVDGNTLVIEGGQEIRLIGVAAPSPHDELKDMPLDEQIRHHDMAMEVKNFVKYLVEGRTVRLELDPMHAKAFGHKDLDGRILCYVWFTAPIFQRTPDWLVMDPTIETGYYDAFLNAAILRAGYAQTEMGWPFELAPKFLALQDEAKNAKRGIWKDETPAQTDTEQTSTEPTPPSTAA